MDISHTFGFTVSNELQEPVEQWWVLIRHRNWQNSFFYPPPPSNTFWPEEYCSYLHFPSILSVHPSKFCVCQLLKSNTWRFFHIFRADQSYMEPVHCEVSLTFWPSALNVHDLHIVFFCPDQCLETINMRNGNCFIFSRHINNLTWDVCMFFFFDCFTFDLDIMTITLKISSSLL